MLSVFNFKISTVISESMEPTINKGDLIIVVSVDEDKIAEEDIIVFNNYLPTVSGGYAQAEVVHRYIDTGIDGDYITQGDNNSSVDTIRDASGNTTTLTYEDVVGKYAFRIPFLGWLTIFFTQYLDPVFLGLVIVNVIIVVLLIKYLKKKPEEEKDESNDLA
jgi:signal peptidase